MNPYANIVEEGDIFFFYRPKVGAEEVGDIEDIQRFYVVTAPEQEKGKLRLFMMGQKKLPSITEDESMAERRNWALNVLTTKNADDIRHELLPVEYETETRGKRKVGPATPAGEGKYSIVRHDGHTELAYVLELPEVPGPTQKEFGVRKEASYIISVKNPNIQAPGFKAFEERKPSYPLEIQQMFGDRRWISVENPEILNYKNTQVLLIGARKSDAQEELGIDLDEEKENVHKAELFKELKIKREHVPLRPLLKGEFPTKTEQEQKQVSTKTLSREEAPGRKGGKAGGRKAVKSAPSAAALSKILAGVDFPKEKEELIQYAERNASNVKALEKILQTMQKLPDKKYQSMAEIQEGLSKVR